MAREFPYSGISGTPPGVTGDLPATGLPGNHSHFCQLPSLWNTRLLFCYHVSQVLHRGSPLWTQVISWFSFLFYFSLVVLEPRALYMLVCTLPLSLIFSLSSPKLDSVQPVQINTTQRPQAWKAKSGSQLSPEVVTLQISEKAELPPPSLSPPGSSRGCPTLEP